VFVNARWEYDVRPKLAASFGCQTSDVRVALMGDLRRIRNDILHHQGVATEENSGKCELLGHWFPPGSEIAITGEHIYEFMQLVPWAELQQDPKSGVEGRD
jgi:hypothetical protein